MDISYTFTRKCDASDEFFGRDVPDPFRWLEDDTASEVERWVKAQNKVTYSQLSSIPFRDSLRSRMTELWDHKRYSAPFSRGEWRYFFMNDGLQNQAVLYREKDGVAPSVFLDPNKFSTDGTASLSNFGFSPDGSYAAYSVSEGGADWQNVRVISCDAPLEILENIADVKFSALSWRGNEGFYYSCYPQPLDGTVLSAQTSSHRLMFHRLGTLQSSDVLVFGGSETPRRYVNGYVTEDGRWLCVNASVSTTGNELYVQDLSVPGSSLVQLASGFEREYRVVDNRDEILFVETNLDAPNNRLVRVDMSSPPPSPSTWIDVIPERTEVLSVSRGGGYFFASYLKDALSMVEQVNLSGKVICEVSLPGIGTTRGFSANRDESIVYYDFASYVHPQEVYSFDVSTGKSRLFRSSEMNFDPSSYVSTQVFYPSADGTRIPMMITHKRGLTLSGDNPCLLYGYGGFNVKLTPSFKIPAIVWMEQGGVYAVPNLRGGGEYGEDWHIAGTKFSKQSVFDDFIAAAEFLVDQKYTSPSRLAVSGASNGGLLVGAAVTQRPELFGAALPAVGVLDMLRYHKFTAGAGWAYDYGTADDSAEMFSCLLGYSPLHNIRSGVCYPATLVTTGDHDDRVVPAHSFKFAARLQEVQKCSSPVLIRIDVKAGHGAGKSTGMIIDCEADRMSFALYYLGANVSLDDSVSSKQIGAGNGKV